MLSSTLSEKGGGGRKGEGRERKGGEGSRGEVGKENQSCDL